MKIKTIGNAVVAWTAAASVGAAVAGDAGVSTGPGQAVTDTLPFGARVLDATALARQRGGTDPGTVSDMRLNGVVGNNSASNLSTGGNTIADGAFAGMNGVPLVVQNSGNNVLIQNATIINLQLK